jgi:hypothetical protein
VEGEIPNEKDAAIQKMDAAAKKLGLNI